MKPKEKFILLIGWISGVLSILAAVMIMEAIIQ